MKAAIINQFGEADELHIQEIPKPEINENEVLLKVAAVGINPVDTKVRAGTSGMSKYVHFPAVLGWDVSGVIEAIGKNVVGFKAGDAVFGCIGFPGAGKGYAEFAVADPRILAKKPNNISFEEAAAVPIAGLTAYQVINEHLAITAGQKVLIQAAAGGVGHLAVQFAKMNGAYVIGVASDKNEKFLKSIGVDLFINYKKESFEKIVSGLDAVLDAMGGEVLYRSLSCVKPGGTVVCLPSSTKDDPKAIELAKEYGVKLMWPMMYTDSKQIKTIAEMLEQKKLKVFIDKIFILEQIAWAHKAIETHGTKGKVVVRIQ